MAEKKYTKTWMRELINDFSDYSPISAEIKLKLLITNLKAYVAYMDSVDRNRGRGTSMKRRIASAANGRKGGRPKKIKE